MSWKNFIEDIDGIIARDPAAKSRLEVVLCYPSMQVMIFHTLSKRLWRWRLYLLGRLLSQIGRFFTGIEIHPGAQIGRRFFADHGMGVVIGETAIIGDDVTLYHGVTLGGVSPSEDSEKQRDHKRHPTLCNGVIVGSGAQILGNIVIGEGARIGANSVVVKSVSPYATAVGMPAREIVKKTLKDEGKFVAYGSGPDMQNPAEQEHKTLCDQIELMQQQLRELQKKVDCQ